MEKATVFKFSAKVPASEGPDLLSYIFTSELVLLGGAVLIALTLIARKPETR
jgi:hypothetical protein